MAEASVPVDLFNPGQVFACLGLVEAAEILLGDAEATFDWSQPGSVHFMLRASGAESPVVRVLGFLDAAVARAEAVEGSPNVRAWKEAWGEVLETPRSAGYPFPDPASPATLVCVLTDGTHHIVIDYWGDETQRDNAKFWAGAGGYPGVGLTRDALALIQGHAREAAGDPFAFNGAQSSSFRFDWRRDYVPIDAGFSLNAHGEMVPLGYPLVEILAAIGLSHARPRRPARRDKLAYEYAVVGHSGEEEPVWMSPILLRASLGGACLPFPTRQFRMHLDWPGQQGQARSITAVIEVTES